MPKLACVALVVFGFAGLASTVAAQNPADGLPDQPFQTVHLMAVAPAQEAALKAAVDAFNAELSRQGCPACAYHLSRRVVGSQGPFNTMVVSNWPGRDEYLRIHDSAGYQAVEARNPVFDELQKTQIYGRFVEVRRPSAERR